MIASQNHPWMENICIQQENTGYDEKIKVLSRHHFENTRLCDSYDRYGHPIGCDNAECYSVSNQYSDAGKELTKALLDHLQLDYTDQEISNIDTHYLITEYLIITEDEEGFEISLSEEKNIKKEKVKKFVLEWLEENENHTYNMIYNYFDGNNWQSIVLNLENDYCPIKEVEDHMQIKIWNQMPDTPHFDGVRKQIETKDFVFHYSREQGNPFICEVEIK